MHLMLSNDDGIDAAGLHALRRVVASVRPDWKISVVAPDREQSASSHALTLTRPLRVEERGDRAWAVTGTPTDCVLVGYESILDGDPPDAVLSGINHGPNLGEDVHYSGTVPLPSRDDSSGCPRSHSALVPANFTSALPSTSCASISYVGSSRDCPQALC